MSPSSRMALLLVGLVCAASAQEDDSVVMGGPITQAAVASCDDQCLCDFPRKPMAPVVTSTTPSRMSVLFGKVSANDICDAASQLQIEMGDGTWTTIYNGPLSTHDVEHMRPDDDIRFRVRERNCAGLSDFSEELTVHTPKEDWRPAPPTLTSATTNQLCVSVNLTKAGVSDIFDAETEMVVAYRRGPNAWEAPKQDSFGVLGGEALTGVWTGCATNLTSFTVYQFRVVFADPTLLETQSVVVSFSTLLEPPPAPTKPNATVITPSSLSFSWSKAVTDNRSPADLYLVDLADLTPKAAAPALPANGTTNGTSTNLLALTSNSNSTNSSDPEYEWVRIAQLKKAQVSLPGLLPGTNYACRVIALNEAGQSAPSPVSLTTTTATPPGPPRGIKFTVAKSDAVRVEWETASPNGEPISSYKLQKYGGPGPSMYDYVTVYEGLNMYKRLADLEPSTYYGFRVLAVNKKGEGEVSKQIFLKTPMPGDMLDDDALAVASQPIDAAMSAARAISLVTPLPATTNDQVIALHQHHHADAQVLLASPAAPSHVTKAASSTPAHLTRHLQRPQDLDDDPAFHISDQADIVDAPLRPTTIKPVDDTATVDDAAAAVEAVDDTAAAAAATAAASIDMPPQPNDIDLPASVIAALTGGAYGRAGGAPAPDIAIQSEHVKDPRSRVIAMAAALQDAPEEGVVVAAPRVDPIPEVESVGPPEGVVGQAGPSVPIGEVTADDGPTPGAVVDVNGGCLASRGKCLEKDPAYKFAHFTCAATPSGVVAMRPVVTDRCTAFNVENAVFLGGKYDLDPEQQYNMSQTSCVCECSGLESSCGAVGDLRFFGGVNDAAECAQMTCSALKFSQCSWKSEQVSLGVWGGEASQQLTMISSVLETCTNASMLPDCRGPADCGGFDHGACLGNGTCRCIDEWTGPDCLSGLCPLRLDECGLHGMCVAPNVCTCDKGFGGEDCLQYASMRFSVNSTKSTSAAWGEATAAMAEAGVLILPEASVSMDSRPLRPRRRANSKKKVPEPMEVGQGSRLAIPGRGGYATPFPGDELDINYFGNQSFTASIFFKAAPQAARQFRSSMVSHGNTDRGPGWGMGMMKGGNVYCAVGSSTMPARASNAVMATTEASWADGKFHQLSCIFDLKNNKVIVAVDGNQVPLTPIWPYTGADAAEMFQGIFMTSHLKPSGYTPSSPLVVGGAGNMNKDFFEGWLSELRIWDHARAVVAQATSMWDPMAESQRGLALCLPLNDCDQQLPFTAGFRHHRLRDTHQVVHVLYTGGGGNLPKCDLQFSPLVRRPPIPTGGGIE